jgi:hypothetical protein
MVSYEVPIRLIRRQREEEVVGNAEAVQDAVQAVGAPAYPASRTGWATTAVLRYFTAWQDLVRHSGGGQLHDGLRGAEELAWG